MRRYINRIIRNISRLRLQPIHDYQRLFTYRVIQISFSKWYSGAHTVLATVMILGYGYQLTIKGRL